MRETQETLSGKINILLRFLRIFVKIPCKQKINHETLLKMEMLKCMELRRN